MVSKGSEVATRIKHEKWLQDIRDCNARPAGMSLTAWCRQHGISTSTYYWRQRTLREACIDMMENTRADEATLASEPAVSFVEVKPIALPAPKGSCNSKAVIRVGAAKIEITDSISDSLLNRILEAASHVK